MNESLCSGQAHFLETSAPFYQRERSKYLVQRARADLELPKPHWATVEVISSLSKSRQNVEHNHAKQVHDNLPALYHEKPPVWYCALSRN
jgi:hypothetical protein